MRSILWLLDTLITLYVYILIASAILSWLVAFNVVNVRNPIVAQVGDFLVSDHRTGAAADPEHPAQSRRHRHLADHLDPAALFRPHAALRDHRQPGRCSVPGRTRGPGSESSFRAVAGGVEVRVRVTPQGGRDAIEGAERLDDGREVLKVRVRSRARGRGGERGRQAPSCASPRAARLRRVARARARPRG